jgi:hypothetical protein
LPIVGEAQIIVRAITTSVEKDIRNGFNGVDRVGSDVGKSVGTNLTNELKKSMSGNTGIEKLGEKLRGLYPEAQKAAQEFHTLVRVGYLVQTALGALVGTIGAIGGGLGALIGVAGGAGASLGALGNIMVAFGMAMLSAKLALGGVGKALGALNQGGMNTAIQREAELKRVSDAERAFSLVLQRNSEGIVKANNSIRLAQIDLNKAYKQGREEIQQLGFDAEDAALSEEKAALALQDARTALAQAQDMHARLLGRRAPLLRPAPAEREE